MKRDVEINGRKIGPSHPPYIICEISGNHNGQLDRALRLLEAAAATGADAIKMQSYTPDTITIDHDGPGFTIEGGLWDGRRLYELYGEAQTPFEWHEPLFLRARDLGVTLFSTPFDDTAVDLLAGLDAPAYKIASFEIVDLALIAKVAQQGRPMIISTGMGNLAEIEAAVSTARTNGCSELILLHCISSYPAPIEQANLATIRHLGDAFGCVSGLSDHTMGSAAAVTSIALGGSVVEKHFTLARSDGGPDAAFSMEPDEFKALVEDCKNAHAAIGAVTYERAPAEKGSVVFRRSLYAVVDIKAGELLTSTNVRSIRPGFGLSPAALPEVMGRRARQDIARGTPLARNLIQED
ncbi:pseudaminic acid synthase [Algicella marina]|uniref:Pseudaminic acid synthase n=1 Tax=Algicella marina TaxID=2683284 RepID=A0A6P1SVW8_9RHOB|nr:pseudaminic acid synthase [Algicella marina]QHQ34598.1 pseudaminic acid synthase [Algicella marina]